MADASNLQTDFRGGEWSQAAQGRMDDKEYRRALNSCFNAYPMESGAWNRRQGTRFLAYTLSGNFAWLITFAFSDTAPYIMEFTDSNLRFYSGITLVMTDNQPVVSISTANPAVMTLQAAVTWATGNVVQFLVANGVDTSGAGPIMNRQFAITKLTTTTFSLVDAVTQIPLDGSTFTAPAVGLSVGRILDIATTYAGSDLPNLRAVQTEQLTNNQLFGNVFILHNSYAPQVVSATANETPDAFAQFSFAAAAFLDGPYFDPVPGSVSANALSGTITLSSAPANTFVATDVGRAVRLYSEPAAWASGTAYTAGNSVKYIDGNYYTAIASSTGKAPNQYPTLWSINPAAAVWAWGTIATYVSGTSVTVTLPSPWPDGVTTNALLYTGTINTWRLGVFSATTGYPSCGVFHEGRLWLGGAQGNRFDGSASNQPFVFSPTAPDGTVGDANAISYIFDSDDVNQILWMSPEHQGIIMGTAGGEWLVQASSLSDPLTPTSIQAKRSSKYKCANVQAIRAPFANIFVQANGRRIFEYMADLFSGRYLGRNMVEKAAHLTVPGVAQLAYQQDLTPVVWARKNDGSLAGMTYKRESSFTSEPPIFAGWHRHQLGLPGAVIESIAVGPSVDGTLESLFLSVLDPRTGYRHVEMLTDMFQETNTIQQAWFVDDALPATAIKVNTAQTQVTLYGFTPYIGQTITVWGMGLDLGDYVVAADGSITLTFGTPPLFTLAAMQGFISATPQSAWDTRVFLPQTVQYEQTGSATVQSYISTAGTESGTDIANDRDNNRLVIVQGGTNGAITTFNRLTGAQTAQALATAIFAGQYLGASGNSNSLGTPLALTPDGSLWFNSDAANQAVLRKFNLNTMTLTAWFGIEAAGTVADSTHMFLIRDMVGSRVWVPPKKGSSKPNAWANILAMTSTNGDGGQGMTCIFDGDTMQLLSQQGVSPTQLVTEARANVCAGQVFQNQANATSFTNFHFLGVASNDNPNTAALGVYTSSVLGADKHLTNSPTFARGGSITPANIDATWTHFAAVRGPVYDKTDNNIIIWVNTQDSVTNKNYVVKVNPFTAAIIWATPCSSIPIINTGLNETNIQSGSLQFWNGATKIVVVNTATGSLVETAITGLDNTDGQFSDDYDGSVFSFGDYSGGVGSPTPLNGTTTFSSRWNRFQGPIIAQNVTAPATFNIPSVPFIGGYTYTSNGQRVRPAEPADSGARNGPGFAKLRRNNKAGFQLAQAQGISIGTQFVDLTKVRTLVLKSDTVNVNAVNQLFTGVARQEVDDPYSFDGMLAWQITRPYPCIVTAIGGFLHTQDI